MEARTVATDATNSSPVSEDKPSGSGFTEAGKRLLLFGGRKWGPIANISFRLGIALGTLFLTAGIVYFSQDCYSDGTTVGDLTWIDAFYYATVSLSTTGYGDIAPVCQSSRLVNVIVITPLRFIFLIVLVGTTIEVLTQRTRQEWRTRNWRKHVEDHTIVVGYGVKGRSAARSLKDSGHDGNSIIVVAPDRDSVDLATRDGLVGIIGDARSEEVLKDAAIEKAGRVIIAISAMLLAPTSACSVAVARIGVPPTFARPMRASAMDPESMRTVAPAPTMLQACAVRLNFS
jgi:FlaA1/EpsC-like NDP-sugar epimerase